MLETKINFIITFSLSVLFLIIAFYYIFNDIVKDVRKNKIKKIRERMIIEGEDCITKEMIPPSIFKINDFVIDLDSVIGFTFESGKYIRFITASNDRNYYIFINDLKFIENTEELDSNSEYKILTDEFSYPRYSYYEDPTSEMKFSKLVEFEKLYNQLLKWKALRKIYLTSKMKATIYDYKFYSLIKNIKFIDVAESDICKKLLQWSYKTRLNSVYGISKEDKQKEKKNEMIVYIEEDHPY